MGENSRIAALSSWADPEVRARRIASVKAAMNRPDVVAKMEAVHATDGYKLHKSEGAKRAWSRPAYRRKILKGLAASQADSVIEAKRIEAMKAHYASEAGQRRKEKLVEAMKRRWATEEYRDKVLTKIRSPEARKASSKHWKEKWADPEYREKMMPKRKAQANTPEALKDNSERGKKLWADPVYRTKMLASRKKTMYGPGWGDKIRAAMEKKGVLYKTSWNAGLTKDTNEMLAKMSERFRGKIPCKSGFLYEYTGKRRMLMRSRWEVAFAQYLDSVGIKWLYEPTSFYIGSGDWLGTTYTPDFLVLTEPEFFVEIKGELTDADIRKMVAFRAKHPKEDLVMYQLQELKDLGIDMRDWILKKQIQKIAAATDGTEKVQC